MDSELTYSRNLNIPIQQLTDQQKAVLFDYAVTGKLVTQAHVNRMLAEIERDVMELGTRISRLTAGRGFARDGAVAVRVRLEAAQQSTKRATQRSTALTPKQRASRKLQGKYLSLIRHFPKSRRAQFSQLAAREGRGNAINAMQNELSRKARSSKKVTTS